MSREILENKSIMDFAELPFQVDSGISYNDLMCCVGKISDMGFRVTMSFAEEMNFVTINGFVRQFSETSNTSIYKPLYYVILKFIQEYNTNPKLTHT